VVCGWRGAACAAFSIPGVRQRLALISLGQDATTMQLVVFGAAGGTLDQSDFVDGSFFF
jgi:hypothetical protein